MYAAPNPLEEQHNTMHEVYFYDSERTLSLSNSVFSTVDSNLNPNLHVSEVGDTSYVTLIFLRCVMSFSHFLITSNF